MFGAVRNTSGEAGSSKGGHSSRATMGAPHNHRRKEGMPMKLKIEMIEMSQEELLAMTVGDIEKRAISIFLASAGLQAT